MASPRPRFYPEPLLLHRAWDLPCSHHEKDSHPEWGWDLNKHSSSVFILLSWIPTSHICRFQMFNVLEVPEGTSYSFQILEPVLGSWARSRGFSSCTQTDIQMDRQLQEACKGCGDMLFPRTQLHFLITCTHTQIVVCFKVYINGKKSVKFLQLACFTPHQVFEIYLCWWM